MGISLWHVDSYAAQFAGLDSSRIDPFAQARSPQVSDSGILSPEDLATYRYLQKVIWPIINFRRANYDRPWRLIKRAFTGEHWPSSEAQGWHSQVVANFIYRIVEEAASMMTDNPPRFMLLAPNNEQMKYAPMMEAVLRDILRTNRIKKKIRDMAKAMLLYGIGYLKTFWDRSLHDGLGDVAITNPNPFYIWKDEFHAYIENSNYVLYSEELSIEDAISRFPKIADRLPRLIGFLRARNNDQENVGYNGMYGPAFASPTQYNLTNYDVPWTAADADIGSQGESVMFRELWVRDPSTVLFGDTLIPKYDHGTRLIQTIGPFVLYGDSTPYQFSGPPYSEAKDISIPDEPYGSSTALQIWSLNMQINKMNSHVINWANYASDPLWIGDADAMEDWQKLTTAPGAIVRKRRGTDLHREPGVPLPPGFFQAIEFAIRDLKDIAGTSINPGKSNARGAMAIETIAEAASYIVKAKISWLEDCLEDMGSKIIKLVQQYYTEDRIVRILKDSSKVDFTEFNGGWIKGNWGIEIEPFSTLPTSKSVLAAQAHQNFVSGAIDQENYLNILRWPEREGIFARKAQAAKAQEEFELKMAALGKKPSQGKRGGKMKGKRPQLFPY